jgi:hypothetical protein
LHSSKKNHAAGFPFRIPRQRSTFNGENLSGKVTLVRGPAKEIGKSIAPVLAVQDGVAGLLARNFDSSHLGNPVSIIVWLPESTPNKLVAEIDHFNVNYPAY